MRDNDVQERYVYMTVLSVILLILTILSAKGIYDNFLDVERTPYIEDVALYDGINSIDLDVIYEKGFLSSIFGESIKNRVYVTDENGVTDRPSLYKISFEVGDEWRVRKEGVRLYRSHNDTTSNNIEQYVIIGELDEITHLIATFTKTFDREFTLNEQ